MSDEDIIEEIDETDDYWLEYGKGMGELENSWFEMSYRQIPPKKNSFTWHYRIWTDEDLKNR